MRINIKRDHCRYIIDKERRKVVCIIEGVRDSVLKFVDYWGSPFYDPAFKFEKKFIMPNKFVGIATCSPDDEWDEKKGKLLAFHRAKHKFNISFFKHANILINTLDKQLNRWAESFNNYGQRLTENSNAAAERLRSMLGDE